MLFNRLARRKLNQPPSLSFEDVCVLLWLVRFHLECSRPGLPSLHDELAESSPAGSQPLVAEGCLGASHALLLCGSGRLGDFSVLFQAQWAWLSGRVASSLSMLVWPLHKGRDLIKSVDKITRSQGEHAACLCVPCASLPEL